MKSQTTRPDYVYVTYIQTTPQRLWRALLDPRLIRLYWFGRTNTSTWQPGAVIESRDPAGELEWSGKVLASRPPRRLVYSFQHAGRNKALTRVTFDIEPQKPDGDFSLKGVKLTVTHAGFVPGTRELKGITWGWPVILSGLKSLLETGKGLGVGWGR